MRLNLAPLSSTPPGTAARSLNAQAGLVASVDARGNVLVAIGSDAAIIARTDGAHWVSIHVTVDASADSATVARVNRLIDGWALPTPKIERDWRAPKPLLARVGGTPVKAPFSMTADYAGAWHVEALASMPGTGGTVWPAVAGTAPLPGGGVISTTAPGMLPTSPAPTAPPVAPVTPSVAAPVIPVEPPKSGSQSGVKSGTLPEGHPGIFREGQSSADTMHLNALNEARIESAVLGFHEGDQTLLVLRGPAGAGKTQTLYSVAARHALPTAVFHVQGMRDFSDWAGRVELTEGPSGATVSTYVPSQFAEAVSIDGPYAGHRRIVILDEITRAPESQALNALLSLTDKSRALYIPDARRTMYVDPAVMFAATANIGRDFTGTIELDTALADRVTTWVRIDYADAATEAVILTEQSRCTDEDAVRLRRVAERTRDMAERLEIKRGASTRALIEAGKHLRRGLLTPVEAVMAGFGDYYSDEGGANSDAAKVRTATLSIFGGQS